MVTSYVTGTIPRNSPLLPTNDVPPDSDIETDILTAELLLADIEAFDASQTASQGAGSRPVPESASSLRSQVDNLRELLRQLRAQQHSTVAPSSSSSKDDEDKPKASSEAREFLRQLALLAEGELDDRRAALALGRGESLPAPTTAQRALESASILNLLQVPLLDIVTRRY
ncbi:hypothetical protein HYDPIDRAFT_33413 [Hydnomerulius pinastri MD-312]|uniref:Unplaced genomic scaffold scaffold_60, whole genome shotgun sequence n=1 Tax=Hydnomerulius pinastri MD-312 TaxID=994086 RepID=A0A0C9W082_9AGAM|nr:hypothetical protein HYDPIDRAFT_33413 [Hydnomerulius pinastri MD-312]